MSRSVEIPAGWYPDPADPSRYRYWQGVTWTPWVFHAGRTYDAPLPAAPPLAPGGAPDVEAPADHLAGDIPTAADPSAAADPTAPAPPPTSPRRWWVIAAAIAAVIVLVSGASTWLILHRPGPSPRTLSAVPVTAHSATLTWLAPGSGKAPQKYFIRRNGKVIAQTAGSVTSYLDTGLAPLSDYPYQVLAEVDGTLSDPTGLIVHTLPDNPYGLTAGAVTTTTVELSWSAPSLPTPDTYVVQRDGKDIARLGGKTLSYQDSSLAPGTDLGYTVVAITRGRRSDPTPTLQVTTVPPPDSEARLERSWDVDAKITGATHKSDLGETTEGTWTFTPTCTVGACTVKVTGDLWGATFGVTLNRSGGHYHGTSSAFFSKCGNTEELNSFNLTITVTQGGPLDHVWAATAWTGTLTMASPGGACVAESDTLTVSPTYLIGS